MTITEQNLERKLLVKTALEAVLANSPARLDPDGRQQRLKAAALLECAEKGYADLTIADIAKRAKTSTATIYATYKDREELLIAAIEMLLAILNEDVIEAPAIDDPLAKVQVMLLAHGLVYAQPFATWLFRLYIDLTWFENGSLRAMGARVFTRIDAYWEALLDELVAAGHLAPLDPKIVAPLVLGPVERWTILSRLGFGEVDRDEAPLTEVARYSAETLFALWGTSAFWRDRAGRPRSAPESADSAPTMTAPPCVPDLAARLSASLDADTNPTPELRRNRIILAAAAECETRGYSHASVADIAARAGVSVATLYKHFKDKAGLFAKVLETETAALNGAVDQTDIAAALQQHAHTVTAPAHAWLLNLTMASQFSVAPSTIAHNQRWRADHEAQWTQRIAALQPSRRQTRQEQALAVNFLLGGVERSSVFARLLFGQDAIDATRLAAVAQMATIATLRLTQS